MSAGNGSAAGGNGTAQERRGGPRLRRDERVIVKVLTCDADPSFEDATVRCTTHDVSNDGLRLELARPVPPGSVLDLWVSARDRAGTFLLTGKVRWCSPDEREAKHACGVRVVESASDDYTRWRAFLREFVNADGA